MTHETTPIRDLDGKVALVTGSARNLGRAIAISLATRGADIVVHHHSARSSSDAEMTAALVEKAGSRALITSGDLSQPATVAALFKAAQDAFGRIDIVVNNAGKVLKKAFVEVTEAEFDEVFGINTKASFLVMQQAARQLQDGGRIINIGTTLQGATTGLYAAYAGSKAPLDAFTRALAKEIGGRGITVNTVAPGPLDTPFFHAEENEETAAYLSSMSPLNRLGEIEDVIPLVDFLASDGSAWVTAQTLFINGGFLAR